MIFSYLLNMQSHPSWVCGLKLLMHLCLCKNLKSHPSWVCGLKLIQPKIPSLKICHTLRGCVD